jgi:hypothetical protein
MPTACEPWPGKRKAIREELSVILGMRSEVKGQIEEVKAIAQTPSAIAGFSLLQSDF